jgi:hypothetical protein
MVQRTFFKNKYRASRVVLAVIVSLTFFSCSPQVNFMRSGFKSYPPREESDSVVIYKKSQDIPIDSEQIGRLEATCAEWMEKCDSASIFSTAETKIKKAGGNALLITKFEKPSFWNNSRLLLNGDVFLVHDFSSPPDTTLSFANKYLYGGFGFGQETGISLPKISYYNFQNRKFFETYYGVEVGIWGIVAWWMSLDCLYGIKKNIFTIDTSIGVWWLPHQFKDDAGHYFQTTINPKLGIKFWKVWLKAGPSMHLHRSDSERDINFGKIGNMYYNFKILIKL